MSENTKDSTNVQVIVRVRPLLKREKAEGERNGAVSRCVVRMPPDDSKSTILDVNQPNSITHSPQHTATANKHAKHYRFDESIWSYDQDDSNYTDNFGFYGKIGPGIVQHLFQGFNVCLLAYGQTSSGKTHTMTGSSEEPGLIPLMLKDIIKHKEMLIDERVNCELKMSYMEIYNEQVKDLLAAKDSKEKCKVRENPVTGPYVEGLKEYSMNDYADFKWYLDIGNRNRSTASTSMNDGSSRSHAIINISLKQTRFTESEDSAASDIGSAEEELFSTIKLVDLAGSERLSKTKVYGQQERMKEGTLINKSLTVLGRCFSILSKSSQNPNSKPVVVPYRDSALTYILKENLAGNSKSFMVFCISPLDSEETAQTLNYANQVKCIKTAAKANKTAIASIPVDWDSIRNNDNHVIEGLKDEIRNLTSKLRTLETQKSPSQEHSSGQFHNLLAYLEQDSNKLKFECKFLRHKLAERSNQANEMNIYADYLENEIKSMYEDYAESFSSAAQILVDRSKSDMVQLDRELQKFDPALVL